MARANRHHLPGYVWHITHRCHKREFLLKFDKDKKRWVHWLYEAKKRFGLIILNFTITSNHIHLLVYNGKVNVIPRSVQLIAGRTAREYIQRKKRKGAFWEDRYHATAVETGNHLIRCLAYIDLNMVRAGVVRHPCEWRFGGYREIQNPKQRYTVIDRQKLTALLGIKGNNQLAEYHRKRVEKILKNGTNQRDEKWTQSLAVGDKEFVMETKAKLGSRAIGRRGVRNDEGYELKEPQSPYNRVFAPEKCGLRPKNDHLWKVS
ncbi:Transposase and inactivated derivatives [Olavius algarvensis Delta 1 endosymbiont]|nr:Transposase and inactivated derivatives [Olavius algarvensis Delta 1 endosymbiont]